MVLGDSAYNISTSVLFHTTSMKAKTRKNTVLMYPNEYVAVSSRRLKSTLKVVTQYLMAGEKLRKCVAMLHMCREVMKLRATIKPLP